MKKFFKKMLFKLEIWYMKQVLKQSGIFLAYPTLVHLEFEREWYYQRYLKGISVKDSVIKRLSIIEKSFDRQVKRMSKNISPEVYHRLERLTRYIEDKREMEETFRIGNELIDEYERKQRNSRNIEGIQY